MKENKTRLQFATMMAGYHLFISLTVAALAAGFVFFVLYPYPHYAISGSLSIFLLMMVVDVGLGPLCTLVVSSPKKSRKEAIVDFSVIGGVQLLALSYGVFSLYIARPVAEVYERKNFRVVTANEVQINELTDALPQYHSLPVFGILTVGTRAAKDKNEKFESINLALAGIDIGMRPSWWIPYGDVRNQAKEYSMPVQQLMDKLDSAEQKKLQKALNRYEVSLSDTYFMPLRNAKYNDWIVLLNANADIIGYAPVDGYKK